METIKKILCILLIVPFSLTGFCKTIKVKILNNRFDPAAISVVEGDTILWNNLSGNSMELVTGSHCKADGLLSSGSIINGKEFLYVFKKQGNYTYFTPNQCSDGMRGLIMVNAKKAEFNKAKNFEQSQQNKSSSYKMEEEVFSKNKLAWNLTSKHFFALKPKEFKA